MESWPQGYAMKRLSLLIGLFLISPASAQVAPSCLEQFHDLPKLAARLHIKPGTTSTGLALRMCDGRAYDMMALINALLDRMDKVTK